MPQRARHAHFSPIVLPLLSILPFVASLTCSDLSPADEPLLICESDRTPLPNSSRFGFFAPELYTNFSGHLDSLSTIFGAAPAYLLWYLQIDDPFPAQKASYLADRGIGMVISMNLKSLKIDPARNDTLLAEIVQGTWDSTLSAFAIAARRASVTLYLRFGYEMNGSWFPWGGQPGLFKQAWRRAHSLCKQAGASNVLWIFSPSVLWDGLTAERDLYSYYPGDSAVDIIGIDGYNYGDSFDQWHSWKSFSAIFKTSLLAIKDFHKPIWIAETGCPSDSRRPDWLNSLFSFMTDNPCVEALLWFNAQKSNEPDFRLESDSASLAVVREWLRQ